MLKLKDIITGYGQSHILHSLHLHLKEGHTVALIGANGAGKSTCLRAISGLLPLTTGSIMLDNEEISHLPPHERVAKGIAHSPEGRHVFADLSVEDNLLMGAFTRVTRQGVSMATLRQDLSRMYELFPRLAERRRQYAGTLSGGEQQMLAMGRALMLSPRVLLLDEPSLGLAPRRVEEIFEIIEQLKAQKMTILLVEQFAAQALDIADEGYILEHGHVTLNGPATMLKNNEQVKAAYLGA